MIAEKFSPYITFGRKEWADLRFNTPMTLTQEELEELQGINEHISLQEVEEVYLPLIRLLRLHIDAAQQLHAVTDDFFHQETPNIPFIIGVAGSVAVGKSTTSRILQALLSYGPNRPKVNLVTTDGFLYPNHTLEERGLMAKKGFPESYDIKSLVQFLTDLKSGNERVTAPVYSHLHYDIMPDQSVEIQSPDIVIIEGINVLQIPKHEGERSPSVYVSDFFDLSIYVDAAEEDIARWYRERFRLLKETAFRQPESFFNRYADMSEKDTETFAADIWNRINKKNLELNIRPTKTRADIIIKKGMDHAVSDIQLRKI